MEVPLFCFTYQMLSCVSICVGLRNKARIFLLKIQLISVSFPPKLQSRIFSCSLLESILFSITKGGGFIFFTFQF